MIDDESLCAEQQNVPGTEPMLPSDGTEPTPSVLQVLMAQANALSEQAKTIGDLTAQNSELLDRLLSYGDEEEDEQDAPNGRDMAGRPIKVS